MTSLEISLALLAGLAIAAVAGYNLWIGRRRAPRPAGERAVRAEAGARGEPSLSLDAAHAAGGDGDAGLAAEEHQSGAGASQRAQPTLSPIADCIVELDLGSPLAGERLIQLTRGLRRAGGKPILVEGLEEIRDDAPDRATDAAGERDAQGAGGPPDGAAPADWQPLAAGRAYVALRVGVLLANRHGPLNAMEFSEFVSAVQSLAEQLSVLADAPDMAAVLARARDLDEICANLDAQVGIAVEAPEPLGVADLARLALECGCVERGNNRHARLGPGGEVLFSLALADAPNRLQLLLDVPRAPSALAPWREMLACGQRCAQRLGGPLVDDAGRPLAEPQLARIDEQLAQRHASLEAAGFPAGSALALRLFN